MRRALWLLAATLWAVAGAWAVREYSSGPTLPSRTVPAAPCRSPVVPTDFKP